MSSDKLLKKVKELREITGVGFKDCKNAIDETKGDVEKSIELLRIKGIAKASKRMERVASEGLVCIYEKDNKFSMIEINSETDFVAKNNEFINFGEEISELALKNLGNMKDILISEMKNHLGEKVKDIKSSQMLTDSPVCLTADEAEMDIHLERLMRQHKRLDKESKKILEINASHDLIKSMAKIVSKSSDKSVINDVSHLLLDQARIVEGELPLDTKGFTEKLSSIITRSLSA